MYHLANLKWLIGREGDVTSGPTVHFIAQNPMKPIPLEELHKDYDIVGTFEKNSSVYLILESIQQTEEEIGNHL